MSKPIDAETESAASDILSLKSKPDALEKFVATYIAQHDQTQVEKVRQFLENKGETLISKQFVPDAKISSTHIDLGPAESKVSVAEFKARAQKDIDDFKKDLAAKSATVVTVENEKRNVFNVFNGKFHSELIGQAKVDFDGGKIEATDSSSGIKYKFDIYSEKDPTATVSYPDGTVRMVKGHGEPDSQRAAFAAKTTEGLIGCSSDKAGILIVLPNKVLDIDTRSRHLLPAKDMHTEPIETRPPRMYVDKRGESLRSENYDKNGQTIEQLMTEVKEVESITDKANQMIAEFKTLVEKQDAAPVVGIDGHNEYGYFVGKLNSEIPGKLKLNHNDKVIVIDDLTSGTKYEFSMDSNNKDVVTISYPDGHEKTCEGHVEQTRGRHFNFSAKTPDGNVGFAKNETAILVALPDKVLDIRWEARHLIPPKHLRMDSIKVSPPRMFLDKRGESLAVEKYDYCGKWLEYDFKRLNQSP